MDRVNWEQCVFLLHWNWVAKKQDPVTWRVIMKPRTQIKERQQSGKTNWPGVNWTPEAKTAGSSGESIHTELT